MVALPYIQEPHQMTATMETRQSSPFAELRAFLTPELRKHLEDRQNRRLLAVFTLLRQLRPGDLETAEVCHRVLLMQARKDIRELGFIDMEWADLPRLVFNLLWSPSDNRLWGSGRWMALSERSAISILTVTA